jgi:hypothetical protein
VPPGCAAYQEHLPESIGDWRPDAATIVAAARALGPTCARPEAIADAFARCLAATGSTAARVAPPPDPDFFRQHGVPGLTDAQALDLEACSCEVAVSGVSSGDRRWIRFGMTILHASSFCGQTHVVELRGEPQPYYASYDGNGLCDGGPQSALQIAPRALADAARAPPALRRALFCP